MLDKDELVIKLRELGYDAVMESGFPHIMVDEMPSVAEKKRMIKLLDSLGYNSTWGITKRQGGGGSNNDSSR